MRIDTMHRVRRRRGESGFTLAELLIVIVIIGLLMSILTPTITAIMQQVYTANSLARINELANGATVFKEEWGKYPGQDDYKKHSEPAGGSWSYSYTGSQVLAAHMFGLYDRTELPDGNPYHVFDDGDLSGPGDPQATSKYAPYEPDMLKTIVDDADKKYYLTISDGFPKARALCYYMSAQGLGVTQFHYEQNDVYTGGEKTSDTGKKPFSKFQTMIVEPRLDPDIYGKTFDAAVNDGGFLLIGPGKDGEFFTTDDVKNW